MKAHDSFRIVIATAGAVLGMGLSNVSADILSAQPPYGGPPGYYPPRSDDAGFYLGADVGPSWVQDFNSPRFGFPASFRTDPGVRFGVEPGFNFLSNGRFTAGAEFETGVIYNYIRSFNSNGASPFTHGDYYQVPVLGNLILKFHPDPMITPYIGFGGGGDWSQVRLHEHHFFGSSDQDDRFDPAAQGIVGVRFRLNPMMDIGAEYKYLADFPDHGSVVQTHAVLASFTFKF